MTDEILVVAYATTGPYEREAKRLRSSLESLGLSFYAATISSPGDWTDAVRLKPRFLASCRTMFPGRPLLYVDADAVVHADPRPFLPLDDDAIDIGVHPFPGEGYISGTIYVPAHGPRTGQVLADWIGQDVAYPDPSQPQKVLDRVLRDGRFDVWDVPPALCWIFDISPDVFPAGAPVVVEHLQASREFRHPGAVNSRLASRRGRLAQMGAK